jgi:hypothetical protein
MSRDFVLLSNCQRGRHTDLSNARYLTAATQRKLLLHRIGAPNAKGKAMDWLGIIIQLIAGAIGGNAAGKAMKDYSLGTTGNSIAGVIGGVIGGQILERLFGGAAPAVADAAAAASSGMDIGAIIQSLAGGGIGGAVLMIIAGLIKKQMAKA